MSQYSTCICCYSTNQNGGDRHDDTAYSCHIGQDLCVECWLGRQDSLEIHLPRNPPKDQQQHPVYVHTCVLGIDGLDPHRGSIDGDVADVWICHSKWNGYPLKETVTHLRAKEQLHKKKKNKQLSRLLWFNTNILGYKQSLWIPDLSHSPFCLQSQL